VELFLFRTIDSLKKEHRDVYGDGDFALDKYHTFAEV